MKTHRSIHVAVLPRLEIGHVRALAVIVGIFVFLSTAPITPADFWWHVSVGREIVATGRIPTVDTYSFTMPGHPYPNYAVYWLMACALYAIYSLGGAALVIFVTSLVITIAYTVILVLCLRIRRDWGVAALCTFFAALLGCNNWAVRPQIASYLFGVTIMWGIAACHRRPFRNRLLVLFPTVMLIWVNSHGSFVIGLILIGMWLAEEIWNAVRLQLHGATHVPLESIRPPAAALLLSAIACVANPRGLGAINYLAGMAGNPIIRNLVPEWAPPSPSTLGGPVFLAGLLLSATILALSPRRPTMPQILNFTVFAALAFVSTRGIVWFGLVMAPVLADHVAALRDQVRTSWPRSGNPEAPQTKAVRANTVFAMILLLVAFICLPWFKEMLPYPSGKAGLVSSETPTGATRFLLQQPVTANLFHGMLFGSYLIWAASPQYPVFVDARIELYPTQIWLDYLQISTAQYGWEAKLQEYGINSMMLSRKEQPDLVQAATHLPSWRQVYSDPTAVILMRSSANPELMAVP